MNTYLFIGASSDIAIRAKAKLEKAGHKVIAVSRSFDEQTAGQLIGDPVSNELPEIDEHIDGLVYFPGSITLKPFRSLKEADFQSDYNINVIGAVHSIQKYLSIINEGASIVLFSTVAVQLGMPFHSSVATSKGAVEGLTRALAAEFAPKFRVNCIAPSLTKTKLASKFLNSEEKEAASAQRHPMKRVGSVDDLAAIVSYLLSSEASWMTGQILHIDGGLSTLKV